MPLPKPNLVALVALLLLPAVAFADFTFVHSSDPHFGAGNNHKTNAKLFAEIAAMKSRPAFVVSTGDICEYGTDAEYELYRETLTHLRDVKFFPTPGNH